MNLQLALALLVSVLTCTVHAITPVYNGDYNDLSNGTGRPAFTESPDNTGGHAVFPSEGGSNKPQPTK